MYETQLDKAVPLIEKFRVDHMDRPELMQYLEKGYFSESQQQRWMLCYRRNIDCVAIDTNNHVESWHNSLKTHFFKDRRKRRPDTVIYIMVKSVIPFYERKCRRALLNVGRMNAVQRQEMDARIRADAYLASQRSLGYFDRFVHGTEERDTLRVRSFQDNLFQDGTAPTFYDITLDFANDNLIGELVRCSCPAFRRLRSCCKHIALITIEMHPIKFKGQAAVWEETDDAPDEVIQVQVPEETVTLERGPKAKFFRHTKSFLRMLENVNSSAQLSDQDRDALAMMKLVYDKYVSLGEGDDLRRKRPRQA